MAQKRKTYIFFGTGITSVSGAPLYYRNKKRYLEAQGWNVCVFSFIPGHAALPELEPYEVCIIPQLKFLPVFYYPRAQRRLLERMQALIPAADEYVVESNRPLIAPWAELLAQRLKARHFLYCLDENPGSYGKDFIRFLWFKYDRREIASIYRAIIRRMLGRKIWDESIDLTRLYVTPTGAISQVADIEYDDSRILPGRINIFSLGRMDKPYLPHTMQDLAEYGRMRPDMSFNVIVTGRDETIEAHLKQIFAGVQNMNLVCVGELSPIPEKLLRRMDVAIASAGSAALCKKFGIATITIDMKDFQPIGILGYNATSRIFRLKKEPPQPLSDLLDMILLKKEVQTRFVLPPQYGRTEEDYTSHFEYLNGISAPLDYFRFTPSVSDRLIRFAGCLIGLEQCMHIYKWMQARLYKRNK